MNGESLGRQEIGLCGHGVWKVAYAPGTLSARCYTGGKIAARDLVETTGAARALRARVEDAGKNLDGSTTAIVTVYCVDEEGRFVPDASPFVRMAANGGAILGTGSDNCDHSPVPCADRRMYAGLVSAFVRVTGEKCAFFAEADGLASAWAEISDM